VRFLLVGPADPDQPRSIRPDQLRAWEREGVVEWLGFREDMPEVLAGGHIVVLPSYYGEGLPKVLMEAASAGRAVVATDWPGCRDAVLPGETGLLVPPRDPEALARAVGYLVDHPDVRRSMGCRARRLALERFGVEQAAGRVKRVYELLLNLEPRKEGCHRLPVGKPEEIP
jgi:glycosyltransferase involved in cell wall biosynthesis